MFPYKKEEWRMKNVECRIKNEFLHSTFLIIFAKKLILNFMEKIIKISTAICGALLAVLGFSALATFCSKPTKYGMPPQEVISGKVTDKLTGKPIKGIKVLNSFFSTDSIAPLYGVPSVSFTDKDGNYMIYTDEILPHLTFSDVDGEENGLYNDTTVSVDVRNIALTPKK